jgi:hypothetical protein
MVGCVPPSILPPTIVGGIARENQPLRIEAKVYNGDIATDPKLTLIPKSPPPAQLVGTLENWGPYPPPEYQGNLKFVASVTSPALVYPTAWTVVVSVQYNGGVFGGGIQTISAPTQDLRIQPPARCNPLDEGAAMPKAFIERWMASPFVPGQQELVEVVPVDVNPVTDLNYPSVFPGGSAVKIGPLPRALATDERVGVLFDVGTHGVPYSNGGFSMHAQVLGTIRPIGAYSTVASGVTYHVHGTDVSGTPEPGYVPWNSYVLAPNFQPISMTDGYEFGSVGFDLSPSESGPWYVDMVCGL